MKENIVDFLGLVFLNISGFLVVLISSFLSPFILILDLIKYIFLNKHINKKQYSSVFSLSLKELIVSLSTLILFFVFCYFCKKFWYLFFTLPILLGLLETIRGVIFKKRGTFISMILDTPSCGCGTPYLRMEHLELYANNQKDTKPLSEEEKIKLLEQMGFEQFEETGMGFRRKNISKHLNEKQ